MRKFFRRKNKSFDDENFQTRYNPLISPDATPLPLDYDYNTYPTRRQISNEIQYGSCSSTVTSTSDLQKSPLIRSISRYDSRTKNFLAPDINFRDTTLKPTLKVFGKDSNPSFKVDCSGLTVNHSFNININIERNVAYIIAFTIILCCFRIINPLVTDIYIIKPIAHVSKHAWKIFGLLKNILWRYKFH